MTATSVDDFINKYNGGGYLDNGQGNYPGECVSLAIRAANEVYDVPYGTLYCSNTGGARDLYEQFSGTIPDYFTRIENDINDSSQLPQKGDLIVHGQELGYYGHVSVLVSCDSTSITVFEQYAGRTPAVTTRSWNGVLGWLRSIYPEGGVVNPVIQPNQRVVGADGVNVRVAPTSTSDLVREYQAGEVLDFTNYIIGEDPYNNGNNIWFKSIFGNYCYSGAFTDPSTSGLPIVESLIRDVTNIPSSTPVIMYPDQTQDVTIGAVTISEPVTPTEIPNPVVPPTTSTPTVEPPIAPTPTTIGAVLSGNKLAGRIATQFVFATTLVKGLSQMLLTYDIVISPQLQNKIIVIAAAIIIVAFQFGYKTNKFKWPF